MNAAPVSVVPPSPAVPLTLPTRRELREWMDPFAQARVVPPLAALVLDYVGLFALWTATVLARSALLKVIAGLLAGYWIARLFILGHDACHQSLTPSRRLNRWLGRLAFLPSLTPYSLWDVGHNVVHHGFTNLKGHDFVWAPLSPEEYRALSPGRRFLERLYRSGYFPWLYYLVEIWWLRLYFPSARYLSARRTVFVLDGLLVSGFALLWIAGLTAAALATQQSVALVLCAGFVLPFVVWNGLIGFVVYVHHTHEDVVWHTTKSEWAATSPFVTSTVHLEWGTLADSGLHRIMQHTAHHVHMGIPYYNLVAAQALLEERLPGLIIRQPFSWTWYLRTARTCQLYDFERKRWLRFSDLSTAA